MTQTLPTTANPSIQAGETYLRTRTAITQERLAAMGAIDPRAPRSTRRAAIASIERRYWDRLGAALAAYDREAGSC